MIFKLALKNIRLHAKRHFLTCIGLIIGIVGIILFGGYVLRMENYLATHAIYLKQAGHLSVFKTTALKNYFQNPAKFAINPTEQSQITQILTANKELFELEKVIPIGQVQAMLTNGCQSLPIIAQGLHPEDMQWLLAQPQVLNDIPELIKIEAGVDFWKSDSLLAANTSPILWSFFNKVNFDKIKVTTSVDNSFLPNCDNPQDKDLLNHSPDFQIYAQDFYGGLGLIDTSIVGLKNSGFSLNDEVFFLLRLSQLQNLSKSDDVYKLAIYFKSDRQIQKKIQSLQELLNKQQLKDFELVPFNNYELSPIYIGSMNFVKIMFVFFLVLICGVVALTIINSIQIAFLERKKDIAVYKSIGFRNALIIKIFQYEYLIITLLCGVVAAFLGKAIVLWNNLQNFRFQLPGYSSTLQFKLEPTILFMTFSFIVIFIIVQLSCRWQLKRLLEKQSIELMRFDS